ncbi:kunitz-like toxin PcKuz3 [Condylostylus longicornis]|uniref:kunitz-like toxin PcKuz3 n=1 Tax=Condylostylus longicornis TaxID=2530218 RepID=UPI00244DA8D3|nr:kunitz-like toxin PcKuz3 [Condylostylus longicornis]
MKLSISIFITLALIYFESACAAPSLSAKCVEPVEVGTCSLKLPRFYYDTKTDECKEFRYGGCRGNNNRFGTKEFCEKECKKPNETKKN